MPHIHQSEKKAPPANKNQMSESIIFSCVLDNHPKFFQQVLLWVLSLTKYAGQSPSTLVVHIVEGCPHDWINVLDATGVHIRHIEPFDPRSPHSNKIQQLRTELLYQYDIAVLCDTDIVFCSNIQGLLHNDAVQARIVDVANPPLDIWKDIFNSAKFPADPAAVNAQFDETETYEFNFNGGFYVIPQRYLSTISIDWEKWAHWLIDRREILRQWSVHVDQVAFGLAIYENNIPIKPLPEHINVPTHCPGFFDTRKLDVEPAVLHYHSAVDASGNLKTTGATAVDKSVGIANSLINSHKKIFRSV